MQRPTRRQFCENAVLGLGASAALAVFGCRRRSSAGSSAGSSGGAASASPPAAAKPRTLAPEAFATLAAICDRILPRDEDPGALDLGVPDYIDAMLGTEDLDAMRQTLGKVFPVLDKESAKKFDGKRFAELEATQQDAMLDTWPSTPSRQKFFDAVISLTMEGAFGDPKYGGNVGGVGFKMMGFTPDPPIKKVGMPMDSMAPMPHHDHDAHHP